jgi:hypothetical protein
MQIGGGRLAVRAPMSHPTIAATAMTSAKCQTIKPLIAKKTNATR